jgi:phosphatidylserine/phosphatidylglycerophosphate/cardiolipin synthase-like enzyme
MLLGVLTSCQAFEKYTQYRDLQAPSFSWEASQSLSAVNNYILSSTPSTDVETIIIKRIDATKYSLFVSVYLLTADSIIQAIIRAKERGVDVKVLLEKSVYQLPKMNHSAFILLKNAGVNVRWSSESDINFNHSKYGIFDESSVLIGTGNFSKSTFDTNRDFFVFTQEPNTVQDLKNIFLRDFESVPTYYSGSTLVVSPDNARVLITQFIKRAQSSLYVFAPSIEDEQLISILQEKYQEWVEIFICLPEKERWKIEQLFGKEWIKGYHIFSSKKPFTHGKTILVDTKEILIWSMNYTSNSLTNNREIGLILPISQNLELYQKIFQTDCKQ